MEETVPLMTGGGEAGCLSEVETLINEGTASNAVQATLAEQGLYKPVESNAKWCYFPGVAGNIARVSHGEATPVEDEFDLRACFNCDLDDIPTSGYYVGKDNGGSSRIFYLRTSTGNKFFLAIWNNAGTAKGFTCPNAWPTSSGVNSVRAVFRGVDDVDPANSSVTFYYSTDHGETWILNGKHSLAGNHSTKTASGSNYVLGAQNEFSAGTTWKGGARKMELYGDADASDLRVLMDFSEGEHGDYSFVNSLGQTVSILKTSINDPSYLIGYNCVTIDGSDDWYHGTFPADLDNGYMFAVFDILNGPAGNDRILSLGSTGNNDTHSTAYIPSLALNGGDLSAFYSSAQLNHVGGYAEGRIIHESKFINGSTSSLRNGADLQTGTPVLTGLQFQEFGIGAEFSNGNSNAAINLLFLGMFPSNLSASDVSKISSELNKIYKVY